MLMAVYGTLRKGCHNYRAKGLDIAKHMGDERITGFAMYHNGSYPMIVRGDGNDSILIEIYDVPAEVALPIIKMEQGAGYEMDLVNTSHGVAVIFTQSSHQVRDKVKILDGDWVQWCKKYKPRNLEDGE